MRSTPAFDVRAVSGHAAHRITESIGPQVNEIAALNVHELPRLEAPWQRCEKHRIVEVAGVWPRLAESGTCLQLSRRPCLRPAFCQRSFLLELGVEFDRRSFRQLCKVRLNGRKLPDQCTEVDLKGIDLVFFLHDDVVFELVGGIGPVIAVLLDGTALSGRVCSRSGGS